MYMTFIHVALYIYFQNEKNIISISKILGLNFFDE